jgi:hypothetical protein
VQHFEARFRLKYEKDPWHAVTPEHIASNVVRIVEYYTLVGQCLTQICFFLSAKSTFIIFTLIQRMCSKFGLQINWDLVRSQKRKQVRTTILKK